MITHTFRRTASLSRLFGFLLLFLACASCWYVALPGRAAASQSYTVYLPVVLKRGDANSAAPTIEQQMQQQVVDLTNQLRQQNGCGPLNIAPALSAAAQAHSQEMADHNYFDHTDLAGNDPATRAQLAGYAGGAGWENIAAGQPTAATVVADWFNEAPPNDGHRRNMLNCSLTAIGVGYAVNSASTYGVYWTQDFGQ